MAYDISLNASPSFNIEIIEKFIYFMLIKKSDTIFFEIFLIEVDIVEF